MLAFHAVCLPLLGAVDHKMPAARASAPPTENETVDAFPAQRASLRKV